MEKRTISIMKAISWRIIASLIVVVIALFFTEDLALAGTIGVFDFAIKIVLYCLYERVWNKIDWSEKT